MKRLFLVVMICLWSLMSASLPAAAENTAATNAVKAVLDKAMEIQTDPALQGDTHRAERAKLVRKLISDNFLSGDMARESIKGQWDKIPAGQRSEFQELFTSLFQDSYTRMVLNFLQKETIEYRDEVPESRSRLVRTVIMRANEHIPVDYHVDQKGARWLIRDVVIDGVSIVENYNITFTRVIQNGGMSALIGKMRLQKKAVVDDLSS